MVALALVQGHLEERPMDLSSIAANTGLDRKTVTRRLEFLERTNKVTLVKKGNRTLVFRKPIPSSAKWLNYYKRLAADLKQLSVELDPLEIMQGEPVARCLQQLAALIPDQEELWPNGTKLAADSPKRDKLQHDNSVTLPYITRRPG
jgi:hypothetical protein